MTFGRVALLAAALAIAVGVLALGGHVLARQQNRQLALETSTAILERKLADQRGETAATQHELDLAERQLAELSAAVHPAQSVPSPPPSREITTWLDRFSRLRQQFEQQPQQRIPEMQLLGNEDWLLVTRTNQLDTEENARKARAAVREAAKRRFGELLKAAVEKYVRTFGDEPPATIAELGAFFDQSINPAILQRYKCTNTESRYPDGKAGWGVQEQKPVDADYDTCFKMDAARVIYSVSWSSPSLRPGH